MVFSLFPLLQDFPPGQEISRDPGVGEAKQELQVRGHGKSLGKPWEIPRKTRKL